MKRRRKQPKQPRKATHLEYDKSLADALAMIRSNKLETLYYSICEVILEHAPLLTIGLWAFIEVIERALRQE